MATLVHDLLPIEKGKEIASLICIHSGFGCGSFHHEHVILHARLYLINYISFYISFLSVVQTLFFMPCIVGFKPFVSTPKAVEHHDTRRRTLDEDPYRWKT